MNSESSNANRMIAPPVIGILVFGTYVGLMQTLSAVRIAELEFTFFPIPKFTFWGELTFLLFVVVIGTWHIALALELESWKRKAKIFLGVLVLILPMLFRTIGLAVMRAM